MGRTLVLVLAVGLLACDAGTEGEGGHPIEEPTWPVAWCRLEGPASTAAAPGNAVRYEGRVRVPGLTDRTSGVDPHVRLRGGVGYGPVGVAPEDPAWHWTSAGPVGGWDGAAAGMRDVDAYRGVIDAPEAGTWNVAFRFSGDGGETWTLCDLDPGSEDGYAPANAGHLQVRSGTDPCEPDPCTVTPPPSCVGTQIVLHTGPGTCQSEGSRFWCANAPSTPGTDCAEAGQVCHAGACVSPAAVDWCRLQGPAVAGLDEAPVRFEGRVRLAGVTDRTGGVDPDGRLLGELGYGWSTEGPDGDHWTWAPGEPDPAWDDAASGIAGDVGTDAWVYTLTSASPGSYVTAWRFSADGGATWTYCDLDDGSDDGFSAETAGKLGVTGTEP